MQVSISRASKQSIDHSRKFLLLGRQLCIQSQPITLECISYSRKDAIYADISFSNENSKRMFYSIDNMINLIWDFTRLTVTRDWFTAYKMFRSLKLKNFDENDVSTYNYMQTMGSECQEDTSINMQADPAVDPEFPFVRQIILYNTNIFIEG